MLWISVYVTLWENEPPPRAISQTLKLHFHQAVQLGLVQCMQPFVFQLSKIVDDTKINDPYQYGSFHPFVGLPSSQIQSDTNPIRLNGRQNRHFYRGNEG